MVDKIYTKKEVEEIIKRATELQNQDLQSDLEEKEGISLEELEEIGAEVGLKNEYLRAAAFKYQKQNVVKHEESNETHNYQERDIAIEIDSSAWENITSELRHYFGTQYGEIKEDPRRLEWTHISISGIETKINLTNRGEHARLRLSQRVGLASPITEALLYGGGLAGFLAIVGHATLEPGVGMSIAAFFALFFVCGFAVYAIDKAWRESKKRKLDQLADKLINQLYSSRETDGRKKLRFETDVAEQFSEIEIKNDLRENPTSNPNSSKKNKTSS